jgi:hypothetical protein
MNMNPGQFHTYKSLFPVRRTQTTCLHLAIIQGIERQDIFRNKADKEDFVERLSKIVPETCDLI